MIRYAPILLFAALCLGGCGHLIPAGHQSTKSAELEAGEYRLDPDHKAVLFKIDHLGFSELVGRFTQVDASLDFDPQAPEKSRLSVVIAADSLFLGLPDFERELQGSGYFDTKRFPDITFDSTAITVTGENSGTVTGDLTIKGRTRPVTLDVIFNGGAPNPVTGAYTLGFAAAGQIDRTAFGLGRFAPAVGRMVTLEIHAEFLRGGAASS